MCGNAIGAECVDYKHIIDPIGSITKDYLRLLSAPGEKVKVLLVARDPLHQRIDLIKRPLLSRLRITAEPACSKADDTHLSDISRVEGSKKSAERPFAAVIAGGHRLLTGDQAFHTMDRGPVP